LSGETEDIPFIDITVTMVDQKCDIMIPNFPTELSVDYVETILQLEFDTNDPVEIEWETGRNYDEDLNGGGTMRSWRFRMKHQGNKLHLKAKIMHGKGHTDYRGLTEQQQIDSTMNFLKKMELMDIHVINSGGKISEDIMESLRKEICHETPFVLERIRNTCPSPLKWFIAYHGNGGLELVEEYLRHVITPHIKCDFCDGGWTSLPGMNILSLCLYYEKFDALRYVMVDSDLYPCKIIKCMVKTCFVRGIPPKAKHIAPAFEYEKPGIAPAMRQFPNMFEAITYCFQNYGDVGLKFKPPTRVEQGAERKPHGRCEEITYVDDIAKCYIKALELKKVFNLIGLDGENFNIDCEHYGNQE